MTARAQIAGQKFGLLTAIKFLHADAKGTHWLFVCECGTFLSRTAKSVRYAAQRGRVVSCGCEWPDIRSDNGQRNATHGLSKHKLYDVHRQMLRRCYDPYCKDYSSYGARGVDVCDAWHDLAAFMEWCFKSGYQDGLTIERRDVNGGYRPSNCTWIVNERQAHNTRRLHKLTVDGETKFISEWSRETGISRNTIHSRLRYGWSTKDAVSLPVGAVRTA